MEKHNNQEKKQTWGTWEELLLASAVNRHGFKDWDTIAMEVQTRTTLPHLLTTARNCEQKFQDLKRRFTTQCNNDVPNGTDKVDHVPWLEELRKLRVAELRREVQRYDVSILSLQLKVKEMVEDRERSLKENEGKDDEKPDLSNSGEQNPKGDNKAGEEAEPEPASSELVRLDNGNKPPIGDESDRENQSVNESNSTGSRFERGKIEEDNVKLDKEKEPPPICTGSKEPNPVGRKGNPVGEESNNGSYDTAAKVLTCESLPPSEEHKVDDLSELSDSMAHSRDGERGTRESSEVQSSASLTRKRKTRRRKEVSGGTICEELTENEEVSVKSQPLVGVLELIKGHEHISLLERRLESQESDKYKNIVRQHVDLEIIQSRLRKGEYSSSVHLFFRDLLLLLGNAVVFFPKDSTESRTAQQLRRLVTNEIKNHIQTQSDDPIPPKPDPITPNPTAQPKPDSLLSEDKCSTPILVCTKRSSMSKPSPANVAQKSDAPSNENKKPALAIKQPVKPSSSDSDDEPPKVKEKPATRARSLRRSSNNNLSSSNPSKKLRSGPNPKSGSASKPESTPKNDKSKVDSTSDKKRSAAADFLKRIKRNGTAEALRSGGGNGSSSGSRGGGGGSGKEQKKIGNGGKGDKGKETASRNNGGGRKNENANSSQSKRSVGRPPKRVAETSAKRGRETSGGKDKRPKKRSRR
ncbi:hypothetical protein L6164_018025 [Bauhinia variegata]|uniref:Uncharacterized protein n=1 Tax=Bauhinia variegata TaxID=167791 RepID=A0ACB9N9Z3_BAUVA|nr:hypothetical protein L6164_018025 [Bauhinia variegata]